MDDNLREELHGVYDTDQDFFLAYCLSHREKFGEEFEANKRNPVW